MSGEEGRYVAALVDRARNRMQQGGSRRAPGTSLRVFRLHGFEHWLVRERDAFVQTAKAALAAAVAWGIASAVHGVRDPVLASVAALVVVQVTVYQSVRRAIQYSAGIVAGMVAALAIGRYLGVNMLTMSLVVVFGLVLGRTLQLGTQVTQVAVTGLLVLAFGNSYGAVRVVDSVVGAVIGVLVNLVIAPPAFARTAAKELADLADDLAAQCTTVAKALRGDWTHVQARGWLDRSRALASSARAARKVAEQAEESLKYHPRKSVHLDDVHRVDEAATALDHVASQLNSLMRGLADLTADFAGIPQPHREIPEELVLLLDDTAKALNAFGRLQLPDKAGPRVYDELSRLITSSKPHAREAAQALHPDEDAPTMLWSIYGALLDDSRRMLRELDPDDGPHREGIPAALRAYSAHPSHQAV
ncbi:MAG TPA: aromatic acid exporter family protein [Actinocrinis sp.]|uniref:FUSC family protein n=1 Tax=Actinocrinis sp. TaxID=1920516 RepID=UPI002DDD4C28|nr:aromatic acid exporter family protein [Actinocrinis sp.]HEV2343898.1 aromatic acid exporter family protein [Actinocrinis sp.]